MRINELRHLVEIQEAATVEDGLGGETETWTTITNTYAAIWPVSASKRVEHQQREHTITHKVRIRYDSGIKSGMRIKHEDTILSIIVPPIIPDMRYIYLDMLCEESL